MSMSDFVSTNSEILRLIQKKYPNIYDDISKDELTLFSLLLHIESMLHESVLESISMYASDQSILSAESFESLFNHAITHGYTPRFATPASSVVTCIVPVYNIDEGEYIHPNIMCVLDKNNVNLKATSIKTNDSVRYMLKYTYKLVTNSFNSIVYQIDEDETVTLLPTTVVDQYIDDVNYRCISFNIEVEQISSIVKSTESVKPYDSLDFPIVNLPLTPEQINSLYKIDVRVNNSETVYIPSLTAATTDKYHYTLRFNENSSSIIMSNGVFGKKVIYGSVVEILAYLTEGINGNCYENTMSVVTTVINETTGQPLEISVVNPKITNGANFEDALSIKLSALTKLVTNERLITIEDYVLSLESIFYNQLKVLPVSRSFSYGTNEISLYLAMKKENHVTYDTPVYLKTDTKALVVTNNNTYKIGDYLVIPSNVILSKYMLGTGNPNVDPPNTTKVNNSDTLYQITYRAESFSDLVNYDATQTTSSLWVPVYAYVINTRIPIDNYLYNTGGFKTVVPSTSSIESSVYSINISLLFGTLMSSLLVTTDNTGTSKLYQKHEFNISVVMNNISDDEWEVYSGRSTPAVALTNWFQLAVQLNSSNLQPENNLTYAIDTNELSDSVKLQQYKKLKTIPIKCTFITDVDFNVKNDIKVSAKFKPYQYANLPFIQACQTNYEDISIFSSSEKNSFLKVRKVTSTDNMGLGITEDAWVIFDVPVVQLFELKNSATPDFIMYNIRNTIREIKNYLNKKAPVTVSHNILFGRTEGVMLEYLFNYETPTFEDPQFSSTYDEKIYLPLEITVNGSVFSSSVAQKASESIKNRLMLLIQSTTSFFSKYTTYDLTMALSDINDLTKLKIIFPNYLDSIKVTSNLSQKALNMKPNDSSSIEFQRLLYRLFVPSLINTEPSKMLITITEGH